MLPVTSLITTKQITAFRAKSLHIKQLTNQTSQQYINKAQKVLFYAKNEINCGHGKFCGVCP